MAKTNGRGRIAPLTDRLNDYQRGKREAKMVARRTVAAQLLGQQNLTRGMLMGFAGMGIIARLRWLLFGANVTPQKGNLGLAGIGMLVLATIGAMITIALR